MLHADWQLTFDFFGRTPIVVEPSQGLLSSDGGLLPIRQFDDRIGLTATLADALRDPRDPDRVAHSFLEMLRARVYGIIAGYEDQNDHDVLRHDPVFLLIAGRRPDADPLASQPTLSRFENRITVADLLRLRDATVTAFLDSFAEPPRALTFDFDAVDDPCHGEQQLALFHAFYDQWQYLPLLVSNAETGQFVTLSLRPGNVHAATGADDDLAYLVGRVRERFPDARIVVRGDCAFGVPRMLAECERLEVEYTFGIGGNPRLKREADELLARAELEYERTRVKQRLFRAFEYRAKSWPAARTTIVKAECHEGGTNHRFVVTNRPGAALLPQAAYDDYVMRGEAENRHKEIKADLGMDRLSDHRFMANFFRLYLHAAAHNLIVRLRAAVALPEPPSPDPELPASCLGEKERRRFLRRQRQRDPFGRSQPGTFRLRLVKVAAEVVASVRRVSVRLAANWPYLGLYRDLGARLSARPPPLAPSVA